MRAEVPHLRGESGRLIGGLAITLSLGRNVATELSNYYLYLLAKPDHTDAVDLSADTIKGMLVTSSYAFDRDTHKYISQVTNEVSGTGYTAGGFTLSSVTVTQDDANNRAVIDAADVTLTAATITARAVVIYKPTGTAGTSTIIGYFDFGSNITSTADNFNVVWPANGIFRIGQA